MIRPLKGLLFSCYFLIAVVANGQYFTGAYIHDEPDNQLKEGYYFWDQGGFCWFRSFQGDTQFSQGTYVVKNDSLTLHFRSTHPQLDMQMFDSVKRGDTHASFEIRAMYSDGQPFPGLRMTLTQSGAAVVTDKNGVAQSEIENPPARDNVTFEVDSLRTQPMSIAVRGLHRSYGFVIGREIKYQRNTKVVLGINRQSRKIVLTDKTLSMEFKKVTRRSFIKHFQQPKKGLTLLPSTR